MSKNIQNQPINYEQKYNELLEKYNILLKQMVDDFFKLINHFLGEERCFMFKYSFMADYHCHIIYFLFVYLLNGIY